jgi:hypothetical protein
MHPFPESDALHARARAFVTAFEAGTAMPEPFDALACDLARFQARHVPGYARLCAARGVDPAKLVRASNAPCVPTDVFKLVRVATFPPEDAVATFLTSGTTIGQRGRHELRTTATYDAAALAYGRWALASGLPKTPTIVALSPSPHEAPDSSLVHMIDHFRRALGDPVRVGRGAPASDAYVIEGALIDLGRFDELVARAWVEGRPVLLLATSFALVHLLEALRSEIFRLPNHSRVMQTGGFKGKSREIPADILRRDVARAFGVPEDAIVGEYGMTELSSQFWETTARDPEAPHGIYAEPPWARVVPVDPTTLAPVPDGEVGIARIEDLCNVDSAFAVLARDRVRRVHGDPAHGSGGFELLGREPGAPPRGCSVAIDEMLGPS